MLEYMDAAKFFKGKKYAFVMSRGFRIASLGKCR